MSVTTVLAGLSPATAAKTAANAIGMDLTSYINNLILKNQELKDGINFLGATYVNVINSTTDSTSNTALTTLYTTTL